MGVIRIIGSRSAGKTTYLSALANFGKKEKGYNVIPINDESRKLLSWSENILEQGGRLTPTDAERNVDELPDYVFLIESKRGLKKNKFELNVKDYSGEIFEKLAEEVELDQKTQQYINSCLIRDVCGCLIMLTAWEKGEDRKYKKALDHFIHLINLHQRSKDLRLAIVMGKCERGEIWPGRIDPKTDLFGLHLPDTTDLLLDKVPSRNLRFFALSAFGVLAKNDPRPNRIDEIGKEKNHAVLRDPECWQPYNLIEPLCWLNGF